GTPTATGTVSFQVTATDSVNATATSGIYTVTINPAVSLNPGVIQAGTAGVSYSQTISATGGTGTKTVTYTITSGAIPAGLNSATSAGDPGTLAISGTPTSDGTVSFTVTATDTVGSKATLGYTLLINKRVVPTITSLSPKSGPTTGGTWVTIMGTNLGTM